MYYLQFDGFFSLEISILRWLKKSMEVDSFEGEEDWEQIFENILYHSFESHFIEVSDDSVEHSNVNDEQSSASSQDLEAQEEEQTD